MQQLRLAREWIDRQAGRQRGWRLLRLSDRLYGQLSRQGGAAGGDGQPGRSGGGPQVRPHGQRGMGLMTMDAWLVASTAASGVPLKVTGPVLLDAAALIAHTSS